MMKKVLILVYDFPPYVSVGGMRPYSWFINLKEFGVYPIVVTRNWDNCQNKPTDYISPSISQEVEIETNEFGTIVKAHFKPHLGNKIHLSKNKLLSPFQKIISAFIELGQFFLPIGNKKSLYKAAKQYLKEEQADCIIASVDPFVLLKYANKLSKKFNIPFLADYRDPWSTSNRVSKNKLLRVFYRYFEKKYNKSAKKIISVSDSMLNQIVFQDKSKFELIQNGYNEQLFSNLPLIQQNSEVLSISLVGSIYKHHPIYSFLDTVNTFLENNSETKINLIFYGVNIKSELQEYIENHCYNLIEQTKFTEKLPNEKLVLELLKSNILLLFNAYNTIGTKLFEYLALKRKILFCFSNDVKAKVLFDKYFSIKIHASDNTHIQADIITQTNSGIIVENEEHLQEVLKELLNEFNEKGFIECNSQNIEQYSRKIQTQKLAEIIKSI